MFSDDICKSKHIFCHFFISTICKCFNIFLHTKCCFQYTQIESWQWQKQLWKRTVDKILSSLSSYVWGKSASVAQEDRKWFPPLQVQLTNCILGHTALRGNDQESRRCTDGALCCLISLTAQGNQKGARAKCHRVPEE